MNFTGWMQVVGWRDVIDVALVGFLIYNLLLRIRGTRAVQSLLGILFVGIAYWVARAAELVTLETILEKFLIVLPFAILVLFQQEIRRALANFGSNPFAHATHRKRIENVVHAIVTATASLSRRRVGALVVVERLEGLRDYSEGGVVLDAELSSQLLETVFSTDTPLHDGAVIVRGHRIAAAACLLPLSTHPALRPDLGTRHRAALGIAEETDSIAIVVSEETGSLSLAHDGELIEHLDPKELRDRLHGLLTPETRSNRGPRAVATVKEPVP